MLRRQRLRIRYIETCAGESSLLQRSQQCIRIDSCAPANVYEIWCRLFCSGSAPLAEETFAEFRRLTGHDILERMRANLSNNGGSLDEYLVEDLADDGDGMVVPDTDCTAGSCTAVRIIQLAPGEKKDFTEGPVSPWPSTLWISLKDVIWCSFSSAWMC